MSPETDPAAAHRLRERVRERYAPIADGSSGCCGGDACGCCGGAVVPSGTPPDRALGYRTEELAMVPPGSNLGLGCGNPTALLDLRPGEFVLDLGSGAGVDCFLASAQVGPSGRVIGVDMTPPMLARARALAREGGFANVEFRLGEIEHLPVADASVDAVVSNCVINLSPDKPAVYREAFRALRPGGRLAFSDVAATRPIPEELRQDPARWASCSSGAIPAHEMEAVLRSAGFGEIEIRFPDGIGGSPSLAGQDSLGVVPVTVRARKPRAFDGSGGS